MNTTSKLSCVIWGVIAGIGAVVCAGAISLYTLHVGGTIGMGSEKSIEGFASFMTSGGSVLFALFASLFLSDIFADAQRWKGWNGKIAQCGAYFASVSLTWFVSMYVFATYVAPYFVEK